MAVYGSACATWPMASNPALWSSRERVRERSAAESSAPFPSPDSGAITMKRRGSSSAFLRSVSSRAAAHRLVGHDERALDVVALRVEVHDHVLHRPARGAPQAVHEPLAEPAGARLGVRRDDDLVVVLVTEGVHDGGVGVGVHHLAVRLDARLAQQRERDLEAVLGGVAHHRVVDDVAVLRLVLRADDVDVDLLALGDALDRVDQGLARRRSRWLRRVCASFGRGGRSAAAGGCGRGGPAFSLKTACTAPGVPYS